MKQLRDIRRRVERLAGAVNSANCDGPHTRVKISQVWEGREDPVWPPRDAPTHCRCGARLEYSHVVHEYRWQS